MAKMSILKAANEKLRNKQYEEALVLYGKIKNDYPHLAKLVDFNIAYANGKKQGISEKVDFLKLDGLGSTRTPLFSNAHPARNYVLNNQRFKIDIVIPVYNALEDVKRCLESLVKNKDGFSVHVYIVNDASDKETTDFLRLFCENKNFITLIEHDTNKMYTKTVNDGLRAAKGDYVITLNSDTIVSKGWLQGLVRCIRSSDKIGIVGPLSNAASWQNVPELLDEHSQFAVNDIPFGFSVDEMADYVREVSHHLYPKVPFVNGFCFMISRAVIDKIGFLDEETFPTGYGEENDYCIRAGDAGFELAIADDVYVFHAKSKSFGHEKRKEYSKNGSQNLKAKHGKDKVNTLAGSLRDMPIFEEIRSRVKDGYTNLKQKKDNNLSGKKVLFLLPVSGGGGGVHSIVQETMGMQRIGVDAKIAVPQKHLHKFVKVYEDIEIVKDLFVGFILEKEESLVELSKSYDVIVGTIYTSIKMIKNVKYFNKDIQVAYYVQDYEPLFSEPGSAAWQEAYDSYTLIPGATLFAKTDWIRNKVYDEHGVYVNKVSPSLDHDVYKPDFELKERSKILDQIVITAMIRPKTPRRGAERTMRLLKKLKIELGEKIKIEIFGCDEADAKFESLERNFEFINNGVLTRPNVALVLQRSDIFIDLSDYQAFGRTGLEAMACGSKTFITKYGGADEYIYDSHYLLDVFDEDAVFKKLLAGIKAYRNEDSFSSLSVASDFNVHKASVSEINAIFN